MGEERPSKVHGGGDKGSAANAKEESDDDTQDVLGFILIYSFGFDVFCWYWLLFVKSLSFI